MLKDQAHNKTQSIDFDHNAKEILSNHGIPYTYQNTGDEKDIEREQIQKQLNRI